MREKCLFKRTKIAAAVCFSMLLLWLFSIQTPASSAKLKNVEWEGGGRIEVHFLTPIQVSKPGVIVRDAAGNRMEAHIVEKDSREIEFFAEGLRQGEKYTFSIKGVRRKGRKIYGKVKGSFILPVTVHGLTMKETDVDIAKHKVSFEFFEKVEWHKPVVSIRRGGKEYVNKIITKSTGDILVCTKKLKAGKKYTWKIRGIRAKGQTEYVTLTGTFRAS